MDNEVEKESIDAGSYELLRTRLFEQSKDLEKKADILNEKRIGLFGGSGMAIVKTDRIRTENRCVARDIMAVGNQLLMGYNVFVGLRKETVPGDVFQLFRIVQDGDEIGFENVADENNFLQDERFVADFTSLYRYMRNARLIQLRDFGNRLLAVFQVGSTIDDVKVLRWDHTDTGVRYLDDNGDREHVFPPSHDFQWVNTGHEDHVRGRHPHVNILDKVFVETVGGDLTIKEENNTADGQGIYSEPVDSPDQSLDDAKILYAEIGMLILLKILPFGENLWRYFVFNTRTHRVNRIDAIGRACVELPEDHGIIFPGGYYLQSGETKTFEGNTEGMVFKRMLKSPNGEDVLYVFYEMNTGRSILLPYNLIRKEVQNPIQCHGYSIFDEGRLVAFRADTEEPTRVHPVQIWSTPFCSDEFAAKQDAAKETTTSYLGKVGNAQLVRGISECHSIHRMVQQQKPSTLIYDDMIAACKAMLDAHYWLTNEETGDIKSSLDAISKTAAAVVDEFEKVLVIQESARQALKAAEESQAAVLRDIRPDIWRTVEPFVDAMASLRKVRGHLITLKDVRYIDIERINVLEEEAVTSFDSLTDKVVQFLLEDDALVPFREQAQLLLEKIATIKSSHEAKPLEETLRNQSEHLDLLTEVVSSLQIDDTQARTGILEAISEVFGLFNRAKATLAGRLKDIRSQEGVAEFGAQFKLFTQSVQSALGLATSPEKCDDQLSRLLIALEELEARFSEFEPFVIQIAQKREETYEALNAKRQQLLDDRQRRADNLNRAADRIIQGVTRRAQKFKQLDELNAYFASDAMVLKLQDVVKQLIQLGDTMRSDQIQSKLKAARDEAARSLRDKAEIYEGGEDLIRFGKHAFAVNRQELELTLIPRDGRMYVHLTGTEYFEFLDDPDLNASQSLWDQSLVSETTEIYRAEYLAAKMLFDAEEQNNGLSISGLMAAKLEERLLESVRTYAADRYDEGYERGVHDHDAALLIDKLLGLRQTAGLLRYGAGPRGLATLYWTLLTQSDSARAEKWRAMGLNMGRLRDTFSRPDALADLRPLLTKELTQFNATHNLPFTDHEARLGAEYLAEELSQQQLSLTTSQTAVELKDRLWRGLDEARLRRQVEDELRALGDDLGTLFRLARKWCGAQVETIDERHRGAYKAVLDEAAVLLLSEGRVERTISGALGHVDVHGILGQHARIKAQTLSLRFDEFLERLNKMVHEAVPAFEAFRALRHRLQEEHRESLRLDEFKPRVLSSFVRNRLINEVYLPLVGDNLAKQLGVAGAKKRTDLMGLLLLISPPGYGKTTLMEYIANRMGLIFMKINGPALGHSVDSIDPAQAPNATSRQELEKLNLALEMGNNVMLYVDDIQHTHPEFLQKFISLCDAQRRIEGVWRGRPKTYDLRGKRFCVCMAGNPYTESGEAFQVPDMLANRADVYNLGDVLSGKSEAFDLSYIENSLTSNVVLARLATGEQSDVYAMVRIAQGENVPQSEIKHNYSNVEIDEFKAILQKMFRCRDVLLKVNATYISSAAQDDRFRVEPRFQLQGSYRNMNKLAEKVVAAMNAEELDRLIDDHYAGEAQTLTTGAEANMLKLKELRGTLNAEEQKRWEDIKRGFGRYQSQGDQDADPVTRITQQLIQLKGELEQVHGSILSASASQNQGQAEHVKALVDAISILGSDPPQGSGAQQKEAKKRL
jgi:MoxR-like ATPase